MDTPPPSITLAQLESYPWFQYLEEYQQELLQTAVTLLQQAEVSENPDLHDYGYIIFSVSKAYEGFLKQYFIDLDLLPRSHVYDRYFRIGRSLNPDVRHGQRDEDWVYDNLEQRCSGATARELWNTWLDCRNHVFHYFPDKYDRTTLHDARDGLERILTAISTAVLCEADSLL